MEHFAERSVSTMSDKIGDFSFPEEDLKTFTGPSWENINELCGMLTSIRNTDARNKTQALVTFLFKLRSGNSNALIASILGLDRDRQVTEFKDAILRSFENDVLPTNFSVEAISREKIIEETYG